MTTSRDHRLLVVTDTHLSAANTPAHEQFAAIAEHARATPYDAVVHLGDVCVDAPGDPDQLVAAREVLGRIDVPLHVIPGNHDVGDGVFPTVDPADVIDEARLARYVEVFGADRWRVDLGSWTVLGVDAQVFGSGLDADAEQWRWLEGELELAAGAGRPVVLCSHKPVLAPDDGAREGRGAMWYVPPATEHRLGPALGPGGPIRLVLSGHVHQERRVERDGAVHVWVPSAWGYLKPELQALFGAKVVGVAAVTLRADATFEVAVGPVAGLRQLEIGTNAFNPYAD